MTAREVLVLCHEAGEHLQLHVNEFVDEFRRASASRRAKIVAEPIEASGQMEGLVAAVVSALCRETEVPAPAWVSHVGSPEPFFAFPARCGCGSCWSRPLRFMPATSSCPRATSRARSSPAIR
jgi:hypothetical protein